MQVKKSISMDEFVYKNIVDYAKSRHITFSCAVSTLCLNALCEERYSKLVGWTDEQKARAFDYIFNAEAKPDLNDGYVFDDSNDSLDNNKK